MTRRIIPIAVALVLAVLLVSYAGTIHTNANGQVTGFDQVILQNSSAMLEQGRQTFRFDTFGDQAFWGDTLKLHQAIEGQKFGGVGPGVSPRTALAVGLKVDVDALPPNAIQALKHGKVNLDDPAVTLLLLKFRAGSDRLLQ